MKTTQNSAKQNARGSHKQNRNDYQNQWIAKSKDNNVGKT
jgi:hypothetical protein